MAPNKLFILIPVMIVLFIVVFSKLNANKTPIKSSLVMSVEPSCDLSKQTCKTKLDQYSLTVSTNMPVTAMKPFELKIATHGFSRQQINKASVSFVMQGMDMGLSQFNLSRIKHGLWQGQAMLPVCTSGISDWLAKIKIATTEKDYHADLYLTAN